MDQCQLIGRTGQGQDRGRAGAGQAQDRGRQGRTGEARAGQGQTVQQGKGRTGAGSSCVTAWLGGLYLPKDTHPFWNAKGWQTQTLWMACAVTHFAGGAPVAT